jgi:hypothetical protein
MKSRKIFIAKKEDTMINHTLLLINYIETWNSTGFPKCMKNIGLEEMQVTQNNQHFGICE